jgi:hypothetical protein
VSALRPLMALVTLVAVALTLRTLIGFGLAFGVGHLFLLVVVAIVVLITAAAALLIEARAAFAEDAEIMVCELQEIFGLDAIAAELGVARHALVLFEQLGGIAALAVVLAIAAAATASGHSLWALPTATTTTAALTIIDQAVFPYRTGALLERRKTFHSKVLVSRDPGGRRQGAGCPYPVLCTEFRMHGPLASGVAAEALCDCRKRPRAWAMM